MKEFFERLKEFAKTTINCAKKAIRRFITWVKENKESACYLLLGIVEIGVGIWYGCIVKGNRASASKTNKKVPSIDFDVPKGIDWYLVFTPKKEKVK